MKDPELCISNRESREKMKIVESDLLRLLSDSRWT